MPTNKKPKNNNKEGKPILVDGKPAEPITKVKLDPSVDWQAIVKTKQK